MMNHNEAWNIGNAGHEFITAHENARHENGGLLSHISVVLLCCIKTKAKPGDSYTARLTGIPDQPRFTIIEVTVDRQEPMVLKR